MTVRKPPPLHRGEWNRIVPRSGQPTADAYTLRSLYSDVNLPTLLGAFTAKRGVDKIDWVPANKYEGSDVLL
jgi:hypothetical protein